MLMILPQIKTMALAPFTTLLGLFLEEKGGTFDNLGSSSFHRTVIDAVNLIFLVFFYLVLALTICYKEQNQRSYRRNWFFFIVTVCTTLVSIAYLSTGSWYYLLSSSEKVKKLIWQIYVFRGVVWLSLAVSLNVQRSRRVIKVLVCTWWTSFFVLSSVLDAELLIREQIHVSDVVQWPITGLLFVCAVKVMMLRHDSSLSESLLVPQPHRVKLSFLSSLIFTWLNPLLKLGYSKPLSLEDIPCLFSEDEANLAYKKFSNEWDTLMIKDAKNKQKNLVIRVLVKVYLKEMIFDGVLALTRTITVVVSPLLLYAFIRYSDDSSTDTTEHDLYRGLFWLGCLVVVKVVESLSQRQWSFHSKKSGMRIRSALMVAIFHKQMKLSTVAKKLHSTGEIVNYIMVDAYRMGEIAWYFHSSWNCVLQLFLSLGILIGVVGLGALPALVPLVICGVFNIPFAKRLRECKAESMSAQDKRLRSTSEILCSMKIIKLQSWEEHFLKLINSLRDNEFKWLRDAQHNVANCTALFWLSPTIISSMAFWGCSFFRSAPLDAVTMFTIIATLAVMGEPVVQLPMVFSSMIQAMVSFDRINKFLLDDEVDVTDSVGSSIFTSQENSVKLQAGNFSWDSESPTLTLRDLSLEVRPGEKVAICGPVGAGKSSLLYAILGEMPKISGRVDVFGSIAYVSQSAWIQSGTIRDNICYGKPMDKNMYEKAINACALGKDIMNFSHGDLTEIGQRGINLSGGQKQRLQLARAVYSDADIYLLDDPFSAVDAHTAAALFKNCVMGALKNKIVILVTHQVEFLSQVDKVLVLKDGQVTQCGSYEDLLMTGTTFEKLVNAHKRAVTQLGPSSIAPELDKAAIERPMVFSNTCDDNKDTPTKLLPQQLTEEEEKEVGNVGYTPYLDYISTSKGLTVLILSVISQIGFVALQAASRYWLAYAVQIPELSMGKLIGVYAGLSFLSIIFVHLRSLFTVQLGLKASKAFFESFMNSIFRAPILFFDSTPVGRILTRASSDFSILDFEIPFGISYVSSVAIEVTGIILVMALVTWQVLIVGVFTLVASKYFQIQYQASAREIIRINGTTKAPIMNYAAEASQGMITIRAFKKVDQFFDNYLKLVDTDAKLFFYSNTAMEWLILRIEALQNMTLFTAAFLFIILPKGSVPPGFVGLSLSYALSLKGIYAFMIQWYCNISNYIVSVERIKQFMNIEPEPQTVVEDNRPPSSWPSKGRVELQDLKIKYQQSAPLVLKGITCVFKEGTRVGIVGRTGSGKTTLISALFRLVEPHSGTICIDGVNICRIGLKDLRTKLSVIPQEPTLFRGCIRSNMDPLGLYSDAQIWEALEKCQLRLTVSSLQNQLDSLVGDEGENWSMGQRQLFCLGRVLLRRNKILVLDEATASIDSETDAVLQKIIREEFCECTVITVAHRVPTVTDSDMVMVLSNGEVVEYDEPSKLMQCNSAFSNLVAEYWSSLHCKG
ncbi:ABC transporter C family member 8 isoform X2 [Spinacia oleracea]|uniref:ABC-type xenobiotic transporter n=1 Tax=Spinacia oleracea TaxID=3562 RepID=A0A9R0IHT0_SPIOL|nr:ABC transporter C family member 8 isoform X2 [Spinacia oleracea]